jgi:ABC-type transporter Mla maintaining outer membrane lipid asymmetry ATPase subunit MlaF
MISLRNVDIEAGGRTIFKNVSCDFPGGSISTIRKTGMLEGSSTLLKCCSGIVHPTAGEVSFKGQDVHRMPERDRYRRLCYCYEIGGLVSLFSIYNNIALPLVYHSIFPNDEIPGRIYRVCEKLDIEDLLDLEPHQLNDVQARLVNLARALVLEAEAIFIDELQSGMSQKIHDSVVNELLDQAASGCTIIMVTASGHDESFAHLKLEIANQTLEAVQ